MSNVDELFAKSVRRYVVQLAKKGADDAHSLAHRPLTEQEISEAERRLGFALPSVLTTLYARVANGGFGFAYGLLGLVGGARQEDGNDAITMYEQFRQRDPNDPHWQWPKKLLPVVHLGCAMFFCVDCSSDDGMVIWFEPNPHENNKPWDDAFFPLGRTFGDLMSGWTGGESTLDVMNSAFDAKLFSASSPERDN